MPDFNVKWKGNVEDTTNEIFNHLIVNKLKSGMPVTIALIGKSRDEKING